MEEENLKNEENLSADEFLKTEENFNVEPILNTEKLNEKTEKNDETNNNFVKVESETNKESFDAKKNLINEECFNVEENLNAEQNFTKEKQKSISLKSNKYKSLAFWLSAVAVLIVVAQIVLNFFGVNFETKIVVEIASFVLAILVSTGVLITQNKKESFSKTKDNIEQDLNNKIENKK